MDTVLADTAVQSATQAVVCRCWRRWYFRIELARFAALPITGANSNPIWWARGTNRRLRADRRLTAQIRLQRGGDGDRAILLLIVLHHRDHRSRQC